jgi:osmotically-inducible protein OsmY
MKNTRTPAQLLASAKSTKAFKVLTSTGLKLTSTPKQIKNGTIHLSGNVKNVGQTNYMVTASGRVYGNKFVARKVTGGNYKKGLQLISEMLNKRIAY